MIGRDLLAKLTEREREVLALILEGGTSEEVAVACGISVKTVETHRSHINEKLGTKHLLRLAVIKGWVEVRRAMRPEDDHLEAVFAYQSRQTPCHAGGPGRRVA